MNLQECKDQIAESNGFTDWNDVLHQLFDGDILELWPDVAKIYACEKVKEALKLVADNAELKYKTELKWGESDQEVDKQSILSLETEILTKINKEI